MGGIWTQATAILALRARLDDANNGKSLFQYQPLLPAPNGIITVFQIPQPRIIASTLQIYANGTPLNNGTDFTLTDPFSGQVTFAVAPAATTQLTASFYWVWLMDTEADIHLVRGANELGLTTYHTDSPTVFGEPTVPAFISTMPDGLKTALILFAAMHAAAALANRFATRYDTGFGDQKFSLSDLADNFQKRVEDYREQAITSRDNYYRKQGQQFSPVTASAGFKLPFLTPKR